MMNMENAKTKIAESLETLYIYIYISVPYLSEERTLLGILT